MRSVFAAAICVFSGCAAQMYDGPRRPSGEVALIQSDGTELEGVDGRRSEASKLEVLPGLHALALKLADHHRWNAAATFLVYSYSKRALVVCFMTKPGHAYRARPVYSERTWRPGIIDETLAEKVKSWGVDRRARDCSASPSPGEPDG